METRCSPWTTQSNPANAVSSGSGDVTDHGQSTNVLHRTKLPTCLQSSTASSTAPPPRPVSLMCHHQNHTMATSVRAETFLCSVVFDQQPHTYSIDRSKMYYLMGCFRGSARNWATVVWEKQSLICGSFSDFTRAMRKIFDHPVRGKDAAKKLFSIRQCSRSELSLLSSLSHSRERLE